MEVVDKELSTNLIFEIITYDRSWTDLQWVLQQKSVLDYSLHSVKNAYGND
jgi:hypothetical protein